MVVTGVIQFSAIIYPVSKDWKNESVDRMLVLVYWDEMMRSWGG